MGQDPYAGAVPDAPEASPGGPDPYPGAEPVHPSELSHDQRNAMLQDFVRRPHVSAADALNYAQQLGLRITSHLEENVGRPNAGVVSAAAPPPPPPPAPDKSWGQDLKVAARAVPYGLLDAGRFAEKVIGGPLGQLIHLAGVPSAADTVEPFLEKIPFGRPQTKGQEYLSAAVRTGVAAAPSGAVGGARTLGAAALSGISSGLSGEAARQAGYGKAGQITASIVGGLPAGLIAAAERAPAVAGELTDGQRVYQSAQRLGMADKLLPADVGGPGTRMATSAAAVTLGGIPIAKQAAAGVGALADARNAVAEAAGRVTDTTGAGQAAQAGARNFIKTSEGRAAQMYEAIPIRGGRMAVLTNTRQALADLTQGMDSNPELSRLVVENPRLKGFLEALTPKTEPIMAGSPAGSPIRQVGTKIEGGQLSWQDMKRFRTIIGEYVGQPTLVSDASTNSLKKLYGALSDDMQATARAEGPAASRAFNRANRYWRGREDRIGSVLNTVLGKNMDMGGNAAFGNVQRMTQTVGGDPIKLGRLVRSLTPDEGDSVRATVIQRLGQAKPGAQNAEGDVFSPAEFATQWNKMDARAKAVLFNKPDMRQALDDIAEVASGMKMGQKFANTSKTGVAVNGIALVMKFFSNPAIAVGAAGGELAAGKVLSSPVLTRALIRVSRSQTPNAIKASISNIGNIASSARDPVLRANASSLQATLKAMNDNLPQAGRAAASPNAGPSDTNQQTQ